MAAAATGCKWVNFKALPDLFCLITWFNRVAFLIKGRPVIQDSRARALPIWGEGKSQIPEQELLRQQAAESDARGIGDVLKIFIRTWPYLIPMVVELQLRPFPGDRADIAGSDGRLGTVKPQLAARYAVLGSCCDGGIVLEPDFPARSFIPHRADPARRGGCCC